jgi:hypothetical protein
MTKKPPFLPSILHEKPIWHIGGQSYLLTYNLASLSGPMGPIVTHAHLKIYIKKTPILCTHYTFPNAKDYVSTKFYDKLK